MSLAMFLRKFGQCAMAPQAMPATDGPWGPHRLRRWHSHQESANPCLALGTCECKHWPPSTGLAVRARSAPQILLGLPFAPAFSQAREGRASGMQRGGLVLPLDVTETITRASVGLR